MGIVSGTFHCVRYRVSGRPSREQLAGFAEAVRRYAFREPAEDAAGPRQIGWVDVHDAFSSDFSGDSFRIGERIVLSLRVDERRVSQRLLRHHLRTAEEETRHQLGKKFLSKADRTAVKARVLQALFQRTLPSVAVYDLLWMPKTSLLLFGGSAESARREFEAIFEKTFGLRPVREIPYTLMEHQLPTGAARSMERLRPSLLISPASHGTA